MTSILSVTTQASDRNLLTIPELRSATGITDGSRDTELVTLGNRVSATIVAACRVAAAVTTPPTLRKETLTEQFRLAVYLSGPLILARKPIVSVTSVTENDDDVLDGADYQIRASAGFLDRLSDDNPSSWPSGKIVVVYVAGWDTVPDDLKLAASKLAAVLWSESEIIDSSLRRVDVPGLMNIERWASSKDDPLVPQEVYDILYAGGYVNQWSG